MQFCTALARNPVCDEIAHVVLIEGVEMFAIFWMTVYVYGEGTLLVQAIVDSSEWDVARGFGLFEVLLPIKYGHYNGFSVTVGWLEVPPFCVYPHGRSECEKFHGIGRESTGVGPMRDVYGNNWVVHPLMGGVSNDDTGAGSTFGEIWFEYRCCRVIFSV